MKKQLILLITAILVITSAALTAWTAIDADWEKKGDQIVRNLASKPCVTYTVNSPSYMKHLNTEVGCHKYDFQYFPKNKTHAPNYGKVYWGLKIAESNYSGTAIYFDWDVVLNDKFAYSGLNQSLFLAFDSRGVTTSWFAFTSEASSFMRRWMSHTNSPRDYDVEDQTWISAELGSTNYTKIEAKKVVKGHCHSKLVNRKACLMSQYGYIYDIPWLPLIVPSTGSLLAFSIAYCTIARPMPWLICVCSILLESAAKTIWFCLLIKSNQARVNQLMGIGESVNCVYDAQSVWNKARNKFKVPYGRIYIGTTLVETKRVNAIIIVSNGKKILKCIKASQHEFVYQHHVWFAAAITFPAACILIYKWSQKQQQLTIDTAN